MILSDLERRMFEELGCADLLKAKSLGMPTIYRMCAEGCFICNSTGPAVDSLRRCLHALNTCNCNRLTPEFDALIQL
jgi:hypothetical protein